MKLSSKRKFRSLAITACSLLVFFPVVCWSANGDLGTDGTIITDLTGNSPGDNAEVVAVVQPPRKILKSEEVINTLATMFGISQAQAATKQAEGSSASHEQEMRSLS